MLSYTGGVCITNGVNPVAPVAERPAVVRGRLNNRPAFGQKRVLLAAPRGYCAGVDRAVAAVEKALVKYGAPLYVRNQIVHNKHVVATLEAQGAIFVRKLSEVPEGARVVFSAHGVSPAIVSEAADRKLLTIEATRLLVTKVHREASRFARSGHDILLVGNAGHEEVEGNMGHALDRAILVTSPGDADTVQVRDPENVVWLSQTTLSVDETMGQNRQVAVKKIAAESDVVIVVGSTNSSNSAPEKLVREVFDQLADAGYESVHDVVTAEEDLMFSLPKELRTTVTGDVDERGPGGRTKLLDWQR